MRAAVIIVFVLALQILIMTVLFSPGAQSRPVTFDAAALRHRPGPMQDPVYPGIEHPRVSDPMRGPVIEVATSRSAAPPPFRTYQPSNQRRPDFQKVGYAYSEDKSQVLPIYARPAPRNPSRFQYYTNAAGGDVSMALRTGRGDCLSDVGCEELQTGDKVSSEATNGDLSVTIYDHA
jgi:hypothetical protein